MAVGVVVALGWSNNEWTEQVAVIGKSGAASQNMTMMMHRFSSDN